MTKRKHKALMKFADAIIEGVHSFKIESLHPATLINFCRCQ